jgi:hypothetical protein
MITDEELAQLPDDPELAFVELERILRDRLNEKEFRRSSGVTPNPSSSST